MVCGGLQFCELGALATNLGFGFLNRLVLLAVVAGGFGLVMCFIFDV